MSSTLTQAITDSNSKKMRKHAPEQEYQAPECWMTKLERNKWAILIGTAIHNLWWFAVLAFSLVAIFLNGHIVFGMNATVKETLEATFVVYLLSILAGIALFSVKELKG